MKLSKDLCRITCYTIHYRPQRSCEGYVFPGVCLSTGGGYSSMPCMWYPSMPCNRCLGGLLTGSAWSGGCLVQGGLLPEGLVSQHALRQTHPEIDGHCCGRYASHWNAFLFKIVFALIKLSTTNDDIFW